MTAPFVFDTPFIDAHQHFWDLDRHRYPWLQEETVPNFRYGDYSALRRNYLPADYARDTAGFAPVKTVHVEAEWARESPVGETAWLDALSGAHGRPTAIVGHAQLDRGDVDEVLAGHAACARMRGIRNKPATAARREDARRGQPGSMDDMRWRRGYGLLGRHGMSFDLQAPWWHLDQAADLARDFPQTQLVLNHTGLPADRSEAGLDGWRRAMEHLAREPNVAVKISGLGLPGRPWTQEDNVPVIRDTIAIFGADRCMFASNYPVDSLVAPYATILAGFVAAISNLPQAQQRALLHDNAARIYRLHD
ncbi:Predicted metal-dependent hydrolase, TIM-barrel fold [Cupriavidus sp. YR651]|uniref:amidohydrolase family protein n=1 Tax=Cupriavidus sp. YR651 TaxID=1855315 RepID=UPI000883309D|nr:amidohydrolase family protein [Cupriavidus sp. YR651]SDC73068.1 Predicted metal-dependent hydrolase, TIM-barrel fold [Cupriavidus sp. YR651]